MTTTAIAGFSNPLRVVSPEPGQLRHWFSPLVRTSGGHLGSLTAELPPEDEELLAAIEDENFGES
jgi:hypothetical protein